MSAWFIISIGELVWAKQVKVGWVDGMKLLAGLEVRAKGGGVEVEVVVWWR